MKSPIDGCEVVAPSSLGTKALEERGVVADLALAALVAAERNVEADPLDPALVEDGVGEIGGRVADDRSIP